MGLLRWVRIPATVRIHSPHNLLTFLSNDPYTIRGSSTTGPRQNWSVARPWDDLGPFENANGPRTVRRHPRFFGMVYGRYMGVRGSFTVAHGHSLTINGLTTVDTSMTKPYFPHQPRYKNPDEGAAALHKAAEGGHAECIQLLLQCGLVPLSTIQRFSVG